MKLIRWLIPLMLAVPLIGQTTLIGPEGITLTATTGKAVGLAQ